jgi:hypothetical protein
MKMSMALLALAISSLSLALQLRGQKPAPPLEKFLAPARLTELERRMERADVRMIRESAAMRDGIGVPFIREITSDHQRIIVRVMVSEDYLPTNHDAQKKALLETAELSVFTVASEFDLESPAATNVVSVQFLSIQKMVHGVDAHSIYAEYRGGELMFH